MDLILKLCLAFLKIGAFCFGGGYAAVGLIENEIVRNMGWLSAEQFINILAIAEMTPGPIAVNTSTFVGYDVSGPVAGILCTLCVILIPSCLALLAAFFFEKVKHEPKVQVAIKGIRPGAIGIIASAGISLARNGFHDAWSLLFFALAAFLLFKLKKSPIVALLSCGALGVVLYGFVL